MIASPSAFADIDSRRFHVGLSKLRMAFAAPPLRLQLGTRSVAGRRVAAGFRSLCDLDGRTVMDVVQNEARRPITT